MEANTDTTDNNVGKIRNSFRFKAWALLSLILSGSILIGYQLNNKQVLIDQTLIINDAFQTILTYCAYTNGLAQQRSGWPRDLQEQETKSNQALRIIQTHLPENLVSQYEKLSENVSALGTLGETNRYIYDNTVSNFSLEEYVTLSTIIHRTATQLKEDMQNNLQRLSKQTDLRILAGTSFILVCIVIFIVQSIFIIANLTQSIEKNNSIIKQKLETERKMQQHQKMEALSTLSGGIAHEFNNILASIQGYTELVRMNKLLSEKDQIFLKNIHDSSRRAGRLVQQIMSFSQPGKNGRGIHHIHLVVENALEMVKATLPRNISLVTSIDHSTPKIHIDVNEIRQVVVNLCTNAWHSMDPEGGTLEVSLSTLTITESNPLANVKPNQYIQLSVKDQGCGIDQELHTRIFEPFFTTKEVGEGTGLGLAVVHGIVQSYDGYIHLESTLKKGSEFKLLLPVKNEEQTQELTDAPIHKSQRKKEHILVVDDEPNLILLYQEALRKYGYQVTLFSDSRQALEAFKSHPEKYDMLLTDHAMPYMTGKQLTKECKKIKPDIHIVMATAYGELIGHDEARQLGICDLLIKPVNSSTLISKIEQALAEPV